MGRKKYTVVEDVNSSVLKTREKKKWQINLRRYVLEKQACPMYAPYFGLDIDSIRKWFEIQFSPDMSWDSFGKTWQFDHVIPVLYFNFEEEEDLFLCWNFTNLKPTAILGGKENNHRADLLIGKKYFEEFYAESGYPICKKMLDKIDQIEKSNRLPHQATVRFVIEKQDYLNQISNFSSLGFEWLNNGRPLAEIRKELTLLGEL